MPSNCPAILQGYSKSCRDTQGGVYKFYITEHANITSFTEASGVLTAITMSSGTKFWTYEQELNTASIVETLTVNRQNGTNYIDQTFNATLLKRAASLSYGLRAISEQDVCIIATEQNAVSGVGVNFILGIKNGLSLDPSESTSGVAMADTNGYNLVFKGMEPHFAYTVSSVILTQVTSPA